MVVIIALVVAVGYGLATDYEVFLVSRMVEARARGMSTAEAIRIGTATTGRLITAAALVLAVVAGSFMFSDLVMMKYLAFGLMAALLLDATVVRMFLVPSVMKLLGDDCWWAPRWARRLQNRLGLGEIDLPDERKRPSRQRRPCRAATGEAASLVAATPRPAHDPTHPGAPPEPRGDSSASAGRTALRAGALHGPNTRPARRPKRAPLRLSVPGNSPHRRAGPPAPSRHAVGHGTGLPARTTATGRPHRRLPVMRSESGEHRLRGGHREDERPRPAATRRPRRQWRRAASAPPRRRRGRQRPGSAASRGTALGSL